VAETDKVRFRYRRERPDGKINDTTCLRNFEKWLTDRQEGDRFFVARCDWVECTYNGQIVRGKAELPTVKWVADVTPLDN
jgi:hypothetical protein